MGKVICNGVAINYRCVGAGSDVILIHGLAANHAFWRFDILLSLAKDYRVTVYDLRGHGYSDMPSSGYTSADMAKDLHCLLNQLDIAKTHLIGHSFGGVVALHYTADHPDRVASVTVVDSRVRALQPLQRLKDWPDWEKAKKRLEDVGIFIPEDKNDIGLYILEKAASLKQRFKDVPLFKLFNGMDKRIHSAELWLKLLNTTTARQNLTSLSGLTSEKLSHIKQPALAIYGEKSTVLQSLQGLQNLLSNCKTVIIPGAGHFFPMTQPKLFLSAVNPFLREIEAQKLGLIHADDQLSHKFVNVKYYQ